MSDSFLAAMMLRTTHMNHEVITTSVTRMEEVLDADLIHWFLEQSPPAALLVAQVSSHFHELVVGARGKIEAIRLLEPAANAWDRPLKSADISYATYERVIRFLGDVENPYQPSDVSDARWAEDFDALLRAMPLHNKKTFDAGKDPLPASRFLVHEPKLRVNVGRVDEFLIALAAWRKARGAVRRLGVIWPTYGFVPEATDDEWQSTFQRLCKACDDGLLDDVEELYINHISSRDLFSLDRARQLFSHWMHYRLPRLRVLSVGDPMHCCSSAKAFTAQMLAPVLPQLHKLSGFPTSDVVREALVMSVTRQSRSLSLRELDIDDGSQRGAYVLTLARIYCPELHTVAVTYPDGGHGMPCEEGCIQVLCQMASLKHVSLHRVRLVNVLSLVRTRTLETLYMETVTWFDDEEEETTFPVDMTSEEAIEKIVASSRNPSILVEISP